VVLAQVEILDSPLVPSAGVVPSGVEIRVVTGTQVFPTVPIEVTQVLRSKTSDAPEGLGAVDPRLVATEVNEIKRPVSPMEGLELAPLAWVTPSGAAETKKVSGTQVLVVVDVDILQVLRT